jgi:hypothetical protein
MTFGFRLVQSLGVVVYAVAALALSRLARAPAAPIQHG